MADLGPDVYTNECVKVHSNTLDGKVHGKDANANLDETHIHDDDDDACAGKVDEGLKERKKINDDTGSVDEV